MFDEEEQTRTQEFALRWLPAGQESSRDIARQQYTFSPPGTGTIPEAEDYRIELNGVTALELKIIPDISGACASLAQMSLA
jgi:hypothetical protein